ncbi:hypothetical protein RND81_04G228200 [Saponaria officinalis]|uniref:Uncharacterized protein n=1 Tax=Saponaria officinalis TaxID=3572 RepID=A0AAW1LG89_SAPOF
MGQKSKSNSKTKNPSTQKTPNSSNVVVHTEPIHDISPISTLPTPLVSSYNDRIRPLLDAVDRLRNLKVMKEGIQLPTIVVVGDQSSGKSSVLESLAGISLPRGQGICTRVPLIMRLQHHYAPVPRLSLEYRGKTIDTDEKHVSAAISSATKEITGNAKGISNSPITLVVKKNGVPDLTMIDLPGITRVPVHGQPENIYEQIREMIMEYITPEESIILNVLSATVDFTTCESIMMSQSVDKTGQRTLAVVTKVDKAPEGLLEKVSNDDVSIGLGYVCVRNRIGDETYEEARKAEAKLFETHPLLSKIDKSIVGVSVLAQKLVQIQGHIISKCLPNIVKQINDKLAANVEELNKLPRLLSSDQEVMTVFMHVMGLVKESLIKILIRGKYDEINDEIDDEINDEIDDEINDDIDEEINAVEMHGIARLADMLNTTSDKLHSVGMTKEKPSDFLMEEIQVLEESKGIGLPNFLPRSAFMTILQRKINQISEVPVNFMADAWTYIEEVVASALMRHCDNYLLLLSCTKRAANTLIAKLKDESVKRVEEIVMMEKNADYTCNPEYMLVWKQMMSRQTEFMSVIKQTAVAKSVSGASINIEGLGKVNVDHLSEYKHVAQQAYDLRVRMTAYWKIIHRRLLDSIALHLLLSIRNLVDKHLLAKIVNEVDNPSGDGFLKEVKRLFDESPSVAAKRDKLNKSVGLLKESKDVLSKIMDQNTV